MNRPVSDGVSVKFLCVAPLRFWIVVVSRADLSFWFD